MFFAKFATMPNQSRFIISDRTISDLGTLPSNRGDVLKDHSLQSKSSLRSSRKGGGKEMRKTIAVLVIIAMAVVGMAGAANYMYEKASVKGVGYKNVEMIVSTQYWL